VSVREYRWHRGGHDANQLAHHVLDLACRHEEFQAVPC